MIEPHCGLGSWLGRWRGFCWLLAAGLVAGPPAVAEGPTPSAVGPVDGLDLAAVVELALRQNPGLQANEERRREVEGGVEEVRADAYPQLDLLSSWSRSRNPSLLNSPDFDEIIEQFPDFQPGEQELWDLGLRLQQPLYSGGKVKAARRLAESVVDITDRQIAAARLDTALQAAVAYYEVLAARQGLQAVRSQEAARQAALEVVAARLEIGEATRLEWLRARSALVSLAPRSAAAAGRVMVAESQLRLSLGLPATAPLDLLPASSHLVATLPAMDLVALALQERPELAELRSQEQALGHQRQIRVATGRPQVDFNGQYGRQVGELENLDRDLFADWLAAVNVRWSLFDGGRRKGQVAQLDSQRQQLSWQQRELSQRIVGQLMVASAEYETARQRLLASDAALEAAEEARRVASETYRQGVALQADLIAAQDEEIQAQLGRIAALFDGLIKGTRLRRALGRLPVEPLPGDPTPGEDALPMDLSVDPQGTASVDDGSARPVVDGSDE